MIERKIKSAVYVLIAICSFLVYGTLRHPQFMPCKHFPARSHPRNQTPLNIRSSPRSLQKKLTLSHPNLRPTASKPTTPIAPHLVHIPRTLLIEASRLRNGVLRRCVIVGCLFFRFGFLVSADSFAEGFGGVGDAAVFHGLF